MPAHALLRRERSLLVALLLVVILLNVPYGNWALYPFKLFSTWVHEMCHGLMAVALGGSVVELEIFKDGSGLAKTMTTTSRITRALVSSAGYTGTALLGAILLVSRRFRWSARVGTTLLGAAVVVSVLFWVRNAFGIVMLLVIGAALIAAGLKLADKWRDQLYALLAATCCLNAFTSLKILFSGANLTVGGAPASSDAHSVAELLWMPHWFWAGLWMLFGFAMVALGLRFGTPPAKPEEEPAGS